MNLEICVPTALRKLCSELQIDPLTAQYLQKRYLCEGITFLTVTLPKLGKAVVRSLELGFFDRTTLTCFAWKGRSLRYFRSLLNAIFDEKGRVRSNADYRAIYRIRQLSEYFYKLSLAFSEEQLDMAEKNFLFIEEENSHGPIDWTFVTRMRRNIESFYRFPVSFDNILQTNRPRTGPGTFAGKSAIDLEWYLYKRSASFNRSVPRAYEALSGYFKPYPSCGVRQNTKDFDSSDTAEVLFVPKDSRGPRVISREPVYKLCLQMAFFDWFSNSLEKWTLNRVNFQDQSVNRRLAAIGSLDGSFSTFDLKDASDRVRYDVVKRIFRYIPAVYFFLVNARTHKALLPSGRVIELKKMAGMGSGLTFAIMAFLIHTSIATEISMRTNMHYKKASQLVYVYGDDVIVPVHYGQYVEPALSKIGLKLNQTKCFSSLHLGRKSGYFRESCGGDYFNGHSVTPIRATFRNTSIVHERGKIIFQDFSGINTLDKHAKELWKGDLPSLAYYYWNCIERVAGELPFVGGDSPVIGYCAENAIDYYETDKVGNYIDKKVLVPTSPTVKFRQDPYFHLSRYLKRGKKDPAHDMLLDINDSAGMRAESIERYLTSHIGSGGERCDEVTIPRTVVVRRKKVNPLLISLTLQN